MSPAPANTGSWLKRLSLRLRVFLLFAALLAGALAALAGALYFGYTRTDDPSIINAMLIGGVLAGCLILAMVSGIWLLFDENVAKPIERLSGELRARTHAHVKGEFADDCAQHLGDLAPAAAALTRHLNEARNELAEAIERETTRLANEKERLITVLADLPVGVILCSGEHQVVLYNGCATELLGETDTSPPALNRSIFDYLEEAPIRGAYESLVRTGNPDDELEISCINNDTGDALAASLRLVPELPGAGSGGPGYILALRQAQKVPNTIYSKARTVVYDFDLLAKSRAAEFANTPLEDLTYVVFDSETTGLLPSRGDEIVQLAAVRIVNGHRVETEVLDTLVNPRRHIPLSSTEIHGINDAMVANAPTIDKVAIRFHRFAEGAVLVAHNAAFDLAFLRRQEERIGLRFNHPVLDTVLLSAIVFGQSENHSLDALAARLGVYLPEEARHTALGDASATAEALLKLLPALKARGLLTFGDVLSEMQRHSRLLKDSNAW
ncbi:MAG TPA: exonuclease domain-containing protein [Burkholderiaceae bacterium]|nr:exonuclease domain-containing protein [Burkholderiaceae bacterium]